MILLIKRYVIVIDIYIIATFTYMPLYNNPGGETPHMKGVEMLVVSLKGVNFGF